MKINGKKFVFKRMHWHTPSERLFDGQRYAVELHLVHEAEDRSVAVTAILYQFGKRDGTGLHEEVRHRYP
ncbi:hypothetical protein Ddye_008264 [Dipteronia dyeriana]|uniref:Alpha-carbonic anhydrase domain-containing protein n=1 Tax=Dipteronia dyeriana TaxID=168575 RepID=A0AAE0CL56_9ROSI|nr:hypothetical protein Ddye_008264 [Dipteronia dyeriana]